MQSEQKREECPVVSIGGVFDEDPLPLRLAENLQALYHREQTLREVAESPPAPPEATIPFDEQSDALRQRAIRRMRALLQRWAGRRYQR